MTDQSSRVPQSADAVVDTDASIEDRTICFCHNVSLKQLMAAIRQGSDTLEKVKADTCASTGCGGCEWEVIEILEQELSKSKPGG